MGAALDKFLDAKYNGLAQEYKNDLKKHVAKYEMLKNVDVFVLDNSIRESTVGAVKGHTVNEKWQIYNEVKQCGFTHIIVAAFHRRSRVDDVFVQELVKSGEDVSRMFAFSEIAESRCSFSKTLCVVPFSLCKSANLKARKRARSALVHESQK